MKKLILTFLVFTLFSCLAEVNSQQSMQIDFSEYDVSCYCELSGQSPVNILNLDNNGSIVLQLTEEKPESQLINYNSSQLELLRIFRLIKKNGDYWKVNFPILNEENSLRMRDYAKQLTLKIDPAIRNNLLDLIKELKKIERFKNTYTILFSYVLDELVWRSFLKQGLLTKREITPMAPFWNGVVWAVYPPREFSCGTNKIQDSGVSFNINWTKKTLKNMMPFVSDWDNLSKLFDDLLKDGKVVNADARYVFDKFGFYDEEGNFTVPIIIETENNELYKSCTKLSYTVSSSLVKEIDFDKIKSEYNFNSNEEALIVLYHEVMWEMLAFYESKNIISKPAAFSDPDKCKPADISDLIFIVKQK